METIQNKRRKNGPRPCAHCGAIFTDSHPDKQFCSKQCAYQSTRQVLLKEQEQRIGEPMPQFITRRMDEGARMIDIAAELGCNYRTLMRHMRDFGITRRSRSEAVRLQWVDNEQRRVDAGQAFSEWARNNPEKALANSLAGNLALQTTSPTSIERRLMDALDAAGITYTFQYVVGNKFLCDLAFPDAMLIVECDGTYWHSTAKQRRRDASKDAYLQACGYTVLRFSDKQIEQNVDSCVHAIAALLK